MVSRGDSSGRSYYGPALYPQNYSAEPLFDERSVVSPSPWGSTSVGIGSAAVSAGLAYHVGYRGLARLRGKEGPLINTLVQDLRTVEELSPWGMLRTFQASTIASSYQKREAKFLSPEFLEKHSILREYFTESSSSPDAFKRLISEGIEFREGSAYWGQGGQDVAFKKASLFEHTPGTTNRIGQAHLSNTLPNVSLGNIAQYNKAIDEAGFHALVGDSRIGMVAKQTGAIATEGVGRFNRLLNQLGDNAVVSPILKKAESVIGGAIGRDVSLRLGVEVGSGLKMAGGLFKKYGLYLPAAYMAYKTVDWIGRSTIGAGPTDVGAWGVKQAHITASSLAEVTGLHALKEWQEETAPGSTDMSRLLGIPATAAFLGGLYHYGSNLNQTRKLIKSGMGLVEAREALKVANSTFASDSYVDQLGKFLSDPAKAFAKQSTTGRVIRGLAKKTADGQLEYKLIGKMTRGKVMAVGAGLLGLATVAPFLLGAIAPSKRPSDLEAEYAGDTEVPIRKGRFWELGRSPYEGNKIDYFRPNWYARLMQRGKETSIWGESPPSPIMQWLKENFTYDVERAHYRDRPYPVTGLPFQDIPLFGPIIGGTIGQLIKPQVYMHQDEWLSSEGAVDLGPGFGSHVATEIGEKPMGLPRASGSGFAVANKQWYRMTEMSGLLGFSFETAKGAITGSKELFQASPSLAASDKITSISRDFYDMSLGGMLGMNEAFRRLVPRDTSGKGYNPIRNTMPSWMPGFGERGTDFQHGDPYAAIPEGEIRLPGEGYATRFPELKGVDPEDYPLIHRYKILADVAQFSKAMDITGQQVSQARKSDEWTVGEETLYQQTRSQISEKRKTGFHEYKVLSPTGNIFGKKTYWGAEHSSALLSALNRMKAQQEPDRGIISSAVGGYWELLSHNVETPLDQLTPFSPASKFVHMRSATEDYERMNLFGSSSAFWDKPYKDFLRPTASLALKGAGFDSIPAHVKRRRALDEYFDILKYVKASRLEHMARMAEDSSAVAAFQEQKRTTLFGMNPYTQDYTSIYRAMPSRERDYFKAFSEAETEEERKVIASEVPENMKGLYAARWQLNQAQDIYQAQREGRLGTFASAQAEDKLDEINKAKFSEGMPLDQQMKREWENEKLPGESYADWYRRTKLLPNLKNIPGPDWVGFHPSVDLDDIKMKVVETIGEDVHDHGLWPERNVRMSNKPYINNQAVQEVLETGTMSHGAMIQRVRQLLLVDEIRNADIFVRNVRSNTRNPSVTMNYDQENKKEYSIEDMIS